MRASRWAEAEAAHRKFEELGYFEVPFESPSHKRGQRETFISAAMEGRRCMPLGSL